jgi:hypothetical protein
MRLHILTKPDGDFGFQLEKKPYSNVYHVACTLDGLLQGVMSRKSDRKIVVALVRSYAPEYKPDKMVHFLTLHSSLNAANERMKDCPNSTWTQIAVNP